MLFPWELLGQQDLCELGAAQETTGDPSTILAVFST